jgi:hypothetical protein
MWMAAAGGLYLTETGIYSTDWDNALVMAGLITSMVVNTLVTGLIVLKIFKVFREVKSATTSDQKYLGVTGGGKLRSIIFIIIESGMALFVLQLVRVVIVAAGITDVENDIDLFIIDIHEMVNVIISLVISTLYFTDSMHCLGHSTYHHPGAGVNGIVFPR